MTDNASPLVRLGAKKNMFHQDPSLFKLLRLYKFRARGFSPRPRFVQVASTLQIWGILQVFNSRTAYSTNGFCLVVCFPSHPLIPLSGCTSAAIECASRTVFGPLSFDAPRQ